MSNFNAWWYKLTDKKPDLLEPTASVTITSEQFKKLLQSAYMTGSKDMQSLAGELKDAGQSRARKNIEDIWRRAGL